MSRCDQKKGLFAYCRKEKLHPGNHDNGKTTWPRVGSDLRIYQLTLAELERLHAERRRLDALVDRHEQKNPPVATPDGCEHSLEYHTEFGSIKQREGDDPYLYREFWHVQTCTRCGAANRESDEYYGADMADIHWKWRARP